MFLKSSRLVAASAAFALGTLTVPAITFAAAPKPAPVTVGDFAVKVTRALGVRAADPEAAASTLRMSGVHLSPNLGEILTEARAASIMTEMGLPSRASGDPQAPMSQVKADLAASRLATAAASVPDSVSPDALPTSCTGVSDRASCYSCCTDILLPLVQYPLRAIVLCGLLCAYVFPPPSTSQPAP